MAKHRIYTLFGTLVSFPPAPKKNVCASTCFSRRKVPTPPIRIWNFQCGRLTVFLSWPSTQWGVSLLFWVGSCRIGAEILFRKKTPGKKTAVAVTFHQCLSLKPVTVAKKIGTPCFPGTPFWWVSTLSWGIKFGGDWKGFPAPKIYP